MSQRILKVHLTSDFEKSFHKLPTHIQNLAIKKDKWFRANPFDKRLQTHKLKGELKGYWSYYVDRKYRILFRFLNNEEVIYYDTGTHEIYR